VQKTKELLSGEFGHEPAEHSDPLELLILNDLGVFTSGIEMRMLSLRGNASLEYNIQ